MRFLITLVALFISAFALFAADFFTSNVQYLDDAEIIDKMYDAAQSGTGVTGGGNVAIVTKSAANSANALMNPATYLSLTRRQKRQTIFSW